MYLAEIDEVIISYDKYDLLGISPMNVGVTDPGRYTMSNTMIMSLTISITFSTSFKILA